jgi:hypothetical protein
MQKCTSKIGLTFKNKNEESYKIIEYTNNKKVSVVFEDGTKVYNKTFEMVRHGYIKNPNTRSVYGVGFIGEGSYKSRTNSIHNKNYICWKSMLQRCYSEAYQKHKPTYVGCTVVVDWHNFQNFAKWFEENYDFSSKEPLQLDKDILIKGNKIYSPETCCFVTNSVNNASRNKRN